MNLVVAHEILKMLWCGPKLAVGTGRQVVKLFSAKRALFTFTLSSFPLSHSYQAFP